MRALFTGLRAVGAVILSAAVIGQVMTSAAFWTGRGITDHTFLFVNTFSYFTVDSNVLAALVFAIGVVVLIRGGTEPLWFGVARGAVTAFMAVTGIVYNTLLRGVNVAEGLVLPWSNEVLHVIGPLLILADWLFAPGRARLEWKHLGVIVAFPLIWAVYTMIRGPFAPDPIGRKDVWYPYPFLNPTIAPQGYVSVGFYIVLIAAIIGLVGAGVIWVSRRGIRKHIPVAA